MYTLSFKKYIFFYYYQHIINKIACIAKRKQPREGTERYDSIPGAPLFSAGQKYCLAQPEQSPPESGTLLGCIDLWAGLSTSVPFFLGAVRVIIIILMILVSTAMASQKRYPERRAASGPEHYTRAGFGVCSVRAVDCCERQIRKAQIHCSGTWGTSVVVLGIEKS